MPQSEFDHDLISYVMLDYVWVLAEAFLPDIYQLHQRCGDYF